VERILSAMNQSGQAVRESAWRIALESWLRSKGHISMELLGHPKIVEILESAFAPFRCEVKYWGGPIKYIIFKLFDKDGNSLGVAKKEKMGVMRNPEKLKFQVFGIRNQLKKEQGLEFSISDEVIERMIG